jgi:hypothetical protein
MVSEQAMEQCNGSNLLVDVVANLRGRRRKEEERER